MSRYTVLSIYEQEGTAPKEAQAQLFHYRNFIATAGMHKRGAEQYSLHSEVILRKCSTTFAHPRNWFCLTPVESGLSFSKSPVGHAL